MYHIAVLTKSETQETFYREQLSRFCAERGLFPRVDCYRGQEVFFEVARKNAPTNAVISLPGVDGLNAVEHLRALFPETRIICRTIIAAHGGTITLSDNKPHGCIFTFTLPLGEVSLHE